MCANCLQCDGVWYVASDISCQTDGANIGFRSGRDLLFQTKAEIERIYTVENGNN